MIESYSGSFGDSSGKSCNLSALSIVDDVDPLVLTGIESDVEVIGSSLYYFF